MTPRHVVILIPDIADCVLPARGAFVHPTGSCTSMITAALTEAQARWPIKQRLNT